MSSNYPMRVVMPARPALPLVSDYANADAWEVDPFSGVWQSRRQGKRVIETIANIKTATPGSTTLGNAGALSAANLGVTTTDALTWQVNTTQDYNTGGISSPLLYEDLPFALRDDSVVFTARIVANNAAGNGMAGIVLANSAAPTTYHRVGFGYFSSTFQGLSEYNTTGVAWTAAQATQQAGIYTRLIALTNGTVISQSNTSAPSDAGDPPLTGWTTIQTSSAIFAIGTTLRASVWSYWDTGGPNPATFTISKWDVSGGRNLAAGLLGGQSWSYVRTRTSTTIPILTVDIGTATYSDAEVIARLARAVNRRVGDTATVRAYIQRGSSYATPADGGAWVTLSSGTFAGLATVGTGQKLSIWLDATSTLGAQAWSFNPAAFGALALA